MATRVERPSIPWSLLLLFCLLTMGIALAGYVFYARQKEEITHSQQDSLVAIAALKVGEISSWRKERLGDGQTIMANRAIAGIVQQWQTGAATPEHAVEMSDWMQSLLSAKDYQSAYLFDSQGHVLLSVSAAGQQVSSEDSSLAQAAVRTRQVILSDFHYNDVTRAIELNVAAPLLTSPDPSSAVAGVVVLSIDPARYIYPLVQSWPSDSKTAETLLIEKDGNDVLYLNQLRHRQNTALVLRLPISDEKLAAAQAVRGDQGIIEGNDYRNVPVWAASRAIAGSPWFLVAKVDRAEITAPIEKSAASVMLIAGLLILAIGAGIAALWWKQRLAFYRQQYAAERERRLLAQELDNLTKYANDIILLFDERGQIVQVNDRAMAAYGYSHDDLLRLNVRQLRALDELPAHAAYADDNVERDGMVFETMQRRRDGTTFPAEASARTLNVDGKRYTQSIMRDITERRRADQARRLNEERLSALLDLSQKAFDLTDREIIQLGLEDAVRLTQSDIGYFHLMNADQETIELYTWSHEVRKGCNAVTDKHYPLSQAGVWADCVRLKRPVLHNDYHLRAKKNLPDGHSHLIRHMSVPVMEHEQVRCILGVGNKKSNYDDDDIRMALLVAEDIWQLVHIKWAAEELRQHEERHRSIVENTSDLITRYDRQGRHLYGNPAALTMTGATLQQYIGKTDRELGFPDALCNLWQEKIEAVFETGQTQLLDIAADLPGGKRSLEMKLCPEMDPQGHVVGVVGIARDMTEHKQADDRLRQYAERLRVIDDLSLALDQNVLSYHDELNLVARRTAETLGDACAIDLLSADGQRINWVAFYDNDATIREFMSGLSGKASHALDSTSSAARVIRTGEPARVTAASPEQWRAALGPDMHPYLDRFAVHSLLIVPLRADGRVIGTMQLMSHTVGHVYSADDQTFVQELADRAAQSVHNARLYESAQQRLSSLQALHTIDTAIIGSFDMSLTLSVALQQTLAQLRADAADVLLFNHEMDVLEYAAGRGFKSNIVERARVPLGHSLAGRVAQERTTVHIAELAKTTQYGAMASRFAAEGFVTYAGAPLIAKGKVIGVLEVFHRALFSIDDEWLEMLTALGVQVAIAIDSAQLFASLQRLNMDLTFTYDTTIEGWARAIDLRDRETDGHTERVTNMAVEIARTMGMSESELVQVRRGALLHDIGNQGVPDSILLKPGPLTDEEWGIVRQHPQHAHDLLSPISHLRLARDIPYAHHEKWDGTGYPLELKGEHIPLAARIFAVCDVFDALTSKRPYRAEWSKDKAIGYIRSMAGVQFDPAVVNVFLESATLWDQELK